ncbi:uncharacterized protein LOC121838345 [Ixodes scapularis]|uniref:uncharacterized protein LOC121838345 n=1 Tax=Ixodes scapularis TaxID=6945 RepID=UPI001A9E59D6|nr:uncharacterized protein LOC121838345 [Ixodes scapularis]
MATRRAQYDARFKKSAIMMAEQIGNSAAAQRVDVTESTIRGWRLQREVLFKCEPGRKGFRGPRCSTFQAAGEWAMARDIPVHISVAHTTSQGSRGFLLVILQVLQATPGPTPAKADTLARARRLLLVSPPTNMAPPLGSTSSPVFLPQLENITRATKLTPLPSIGHSCFHIHNSQEVLRHFPTFLEIDIRPKKWGGRRLGDGR